MPLDPQARAFLDQAAALKVPPLHTFTPQAIRAGARPGVLPSEAVEAVANVEDLASPGPAGDAPLRIYTPYGQGPHPILVFFHGGGFVLGTLDLFDNFCRTLTNGAGCLVVSVDYRLAPEHKFPAGLEDCYAATCWAVAHAAELGGDPARLAVGGESAGGDLAAVVCHLARDQGGASLVFQLLVNPVTDLTMSTPSMDAFAEGNGLTKQDMAWFIGHYTNRDDDKRNPLASPLLAADLHGLPPALIITAEFDPLRDEGEQYGQRLQDAGVPATVSRYPGMIHGFTIIGAAWDRSRQATAEAAAALRAAFARTQPSPYGPAGGRLL